MLEELKLLLGIPKTDTGQDDLLNLILQSVTDRLKNLLGGLEIPDTMNHIIVEVSVIRFNRIGSEGLSTHTVEGESLAYSGNDFDGFTDEINAYLDSVQKNSKKGGFRFL